MPPRGSIAPLPSDLPPAKRELVLAMRALRAAARGSLEAVAAGCRSTSSTLSRLMRGEFTYPPEISLILALRSHAAQRSEAELPSEADLRALLDAMAAEREAHEAAEPADRSVEGVLLAANVGGTGGNADAPVPPTAGDRRIAADRGGDWPADEFQGHLDGSRYEHAVGMLDHAGSEAPATEAAAAIMACRARGLDEAADTLLRKVKARSAEEVLKVVGCLLGGGDEIDAYALAGAPA